MSRHLFRSYLKWLLLLLCFLFLFQKKIMYERNEDGSSVHLCSTESLNKKYSTSLRISVLGSLFWHIQVTYTIKVSSFERP